MEKMKQKIDYYEFLIDFVAHEIRNPLAALVLFARLLEEGSYGKISDRQREVLKRILANAGRIEHMAEDFLNLSRIEGGEGYLRMESLDLYGDIIGPVIASMEQKHLFTPEQRESFLAEVPATTTLSGDRGLLQVVFDNLFFNAVKYGREGGKIRYGWRNSGGDLVVTVRNEGQGVRKKDLEVIFEKFVRLRDPRIPPRKGTGLGLYNVRKILERHGGRAWAESQYGRSFTVCLAFPRKIPPARPTGKSRPARRFS